MIPRRIKFTFVFAASMVSLAIAIAVISCRSAVNHRSDLSGFPKSLNILPADMERIAVGAVETFRVTAEFRVPQQVAFVPTWTSTGSCKIVKTDGDSVDYVGTKKGACILIVDVKGLKTTKRITVSDAAAKSLSLSKQSLNLIEGTTATVKATATFTDGSTQDVSKSVSWSTTNSSVATIATGEARAIGAGSAVLEATLKDLSASVDVTVTESSNIVSLSLQSEPAGELEGNIQKLYALAVMKNGSVQEVSNDCSWISSAPSSATVGDVSGSKGLVQFLVPSATVDITASLSGHTATRAVTIESPTLSSLTMSPSSPITVPANYSTRLSITGVYSNGTVLDLTEAATWVSSASAVASVSDTLSSKGLLSGLTAGTSVITATVDGRTATLTVNVTTATLLSADVVPFSITMHLGVQEQFVLVGSFSDGTTLDVTRQATWTTSNASLVTVSDSADTKGLATAIAAGSVTITGAVGAVSDTSTVTVSSSTLLSLDIAPAGPSLGTSESLALVLTATYADASTKVVTTLGEWSTADVAVAIVNNLAKKKGLLTGISAGTTNVSAEFGGLSTSESVSVSATPSSPTLIGIAITPSSATSLVAGTKTFAATGMFSDGSASLLSTGLNWLSSNTAAATINVSNGIATAVAAGVSLITVTKDGISAAIAASFTVTPPAAPENPTGFSATAASTSAIDLSWTSGGGGTVGHFIRYQSGSAPANCASGTLISTGTIGSASTYQLTGLSSATLYGFRICAVNDNSPVDQSSGVTATATTNSPSPTLTFSGTSFAEAGANDGSISATRTITLANDTWTAGPFTSGNQYNVSNIPAGLSFVVTRDSTTQLTLSFTGNASAHANVNDISNISLSFVAAAFTSGIAAASNNPQLLTIDFADPGSTLSFSSTSFAEANANDGSISATATITISNDTWVAGAYTNSAQYTVTNIPAGLSFVVTRTSATVLTLSFTGNASSHANANDVSNISLTMNISAFTSGVVSNNNNPQTLSIDYNDPVTLTYSATSFAEALANDGSISATATITIANDTWVAGAYANASQYTVTNIPAGLTFVVTRTSASVLTLSFTGSASSHANANDVSNISLTMNASAFTSGVAASSNNPQTLSIDYTDPVTVTYSATTFAEAAVNNGSITATATITIANDQWALGAYVDGGKYGVTNIPAGLTFVVTRTSASVLTLSFTGSASSHANANDVSNIGLTLNATAFVSGFASSNNNPQTLSIDYNDPVTLTYSGTSFAEAAANDGSITATRTITIANDTWVAGAYSNASQYTVTNIPAGLTFVVTRTSASVLTLSFTGSASSHANANDVSNISLTMNASAFTTGVASSNNNPQTLSIDYNDPVTLTYSGSSFAEAAANDGSITATRTITIANDTWVAGAYSNASQYTVTNIPAGLTFVVTRTSASVLTLSFTGSASSHANANDVSNISLTMNASAFTTGVASSNNNPQTLSIDYNDPVTLTYSATSFAEALANDGSISATATITIANDTWVAGAYSNASQYTVTNIPAGLTFVVTRTSASVLTLSFTGSASSHANANDVSNISLTMNASAFTTGVASSNNNPQTLSIDYNDPVTLTYSGTSFAEAAANDGSITATRTITIANDQWALGAYVDGGKYGVTNIPAGLTFVVTRTSASVLTLSFTGSASSHANANDVSNIGLTLNATAFVSGFASSNNNPQTLSIDYNDPVTLTYSATTFTEPGANDGSVTSTATITIANDTWVAGTYSNASQYTVTNIPSGLTFVVTRTSASVLTLSFTGNASSHANANDVSNISLTMNTSAFTSGVASSNNNPKTLSIDFIDASATLSYSGTSFVEGWDNTGRVGQEQVITISGDTWTSGTYTSGSQFSVANVPSGLTLVVTRFSTTELVVSFSGNASAHGNANDVNNISLTLNNSAFTSGSATSNNNPQTLSIDFSNGSMGMQEVFLTTTQYSGNLGGLHGADAKCQSEADAAGRTNGVYKAILSSESVSASSRLWIGATVNDPDFNGIVSGAADMWDGTIGQAIYLSTQSVSLTGSYVWTGSTSSGGVSSGNNCSDWSSTSGNGMAGTTNADSTWVAAATQACSGPKRLYCISGQ